jgi:hypothetical protein
MSIISIQRLASATVAVLALAFASGCATKAPSYNANIENVGLLKKSGAEPVSGINITVAPGLSGAAELGVRASTLLSPVGSNFADYVSDALKRELELAKLINPQSPLNITGELLKNEIDASGFSVGKGSISARIVVKNGSTVRFDKVKSADITWESSFVGAVAIPKAIESYPELVQKLVTHLINDPEFTAALRK